MNDKNLSTVYDPGSVERKWYDHWLRHNYFHPEPDSREKYSITIPPPNVTGSLHIGHALCYSIQDVLVRWKRMQGFNTLCLPGTDHAGIATQNKVEQQLAGEGVTRQELGREKFLERVWDWKTEYGGQILHQFKTMGFSFDWERERFTMDEGYVDAVLESFVRLFNKGYIYRGARVINWCPRCHTAISDIEVEHQEQNGHLWYINYPLADGSGFVTVATTRPETMLGDTAVTVNPEDARYQHLIGKNVKLPLTDREIPIIADDFVDMNFGTGAVKATPAHDPNDFEIGLRHNLPQVVVIAPDGTMSELAGEKYSGLDRSDARKAVLKDLEELGLLVKVDDHLHQVGACERCHTTIEPLLSEQWFCRMKELAQPALDVVKQAKINFYPERYTNIYLDWMENVRDWCISRQLWWGHRIPVWKCSDCGQYTAAKNSLEACEKCGSANVAQDPDVLDTWFSSALWPFATMGWPEPTKELEYYYPTDVLVTSREILYLWVARMIFSSLEYLDGEIPFKDVYIYATVLNEEGKRMSKSLGTGVDPLDLIERFGADALRFSLILHAGKNQDMRFSDQRVETVRNFGNKIWNASRFVIMNLEDFEPGEIDRQSLKLEDRWILSRLNQLIDTVNRSFTSYDMDDASKALYDFIWNEYCDWYLEMAKPRLRVQGADKILVQNVLYSVLERTMRLLHPVMPFITEEIWQVLPHNGDTIMLAPYPESDDSWNDLEAQESMDTLMEVVRTIRNLRAETAVQPGKQISLVAVANPQIRSIVESSSERIYSLARVQYLEFVDQLPEADRGRYAGVHMSGADFYVDIAGLVDAEKELGRIDTELVSIEKELKRVSGKLSNESFIAKAPAAVVEKERKIEAELLDKQSKLVERRNLFKAEVLRS